MPGDEPFRVPLPSCSTCGARPGKACVRPSGHRGNFVGHAERVRRAERDLESAGAPRGLYEPRGGFAVLVERISDDQVFHPYTRELVAADANGAPVTAPVSVPDGTQEVLF
jgi:hypothetical protein